nr:hypothetical protein [Archangium sp.]
MPVVKNYIISGHGKLNYGYSNLANYELNDASQPISLKKNIRIVAYIPPGTVFSAVSGRQIQKIISQRTRQLSVNEGGVDELRQHLRAKATMKRQNFATAQPGKKFFNYAYEDGGDELRRYPKLIKAGGKEGFGNNKDLYDYTITGPSSEEQKVAFGDFKWGVLAFDSGQAVPQQVREFGVKENAGSLSSLINTYATNNAYVYFFHLIFCRVEILDASGQRGLTDELQTTYLHFISYSWLKEVGGGAWIWGD